MPTEEDEITVWMNQLDDQSSQAARKIWEHYYEKLIRYASRKLGDAPRRMVDEEDIVVSAMHSLHRGLRDGRFPDFASRDDLWRILLTITSNKAKKSIRREMTQKRGGGAIRGESIFVRANEDGPGIAGMAGTVQFDDPFPAFPRVIEDAAQYALGPLQRIKHATFAGRQLFLLWATSLWTVVRLATAPRSGA